MIGCRQNQGAVSEKAIQPYMLLLKPDKIAIIVLHELTHILEPSHNAVFWGYMTQFYPNWKRVRKYLNDEVPE